MTTIKAGICFDDYTQFEVEFWDDGKYRIRLFIDDDSGDDFYVAKDQSEIAEILRTKIDPVVPNQQYRRSFVKVVDFVIQMVNNTK